MAINFSIYSNVNNTSRSISVDFLGDILAPSVGQANSASTQYFFKFTSNNKNIDNKAMPVKITRSFTDLALNGTKQSETDTANAYTDIRSMIVDYFYDYIQGHTADQYSSGCTEQKPMKFN